MRALDTEARFQISMKTVCALVTHFASGFKLKAPIPINKWRLVFKGFEERRTQRNFCVSEVMTSV